jgi:hypothetical protein
MKLKKVLLTAAVSTFGFVPTASADDPFIVLGPNVKVVFTQVVIDGNTVTQAVAAVTEVVGNVTTVKRQIEVTVPTGDPASPFEKRVTQETTVATLVGGLYTVETTTDLFTTPLDANEDPTGPVVETPGTPIVENNVDPGDLDLPPVTTFTPVDESLDDPIEFSAG